MKRATKSIITFILALAMVISLVPVSAMAKTTYHAYMNIQTDTSWVFRDDYANAKTGHTSKVFKQLSMSQKDGSIKKMKGTFKDATLKKNGTYTVTLTSPDFNGDKHISVLALSTDIPLTKKGVKFTNIKAIFGTTTKKTFKTAIFDPNEKKYYKPLLLNSWNNQVKDCFAYSLPVSKISITFTVKGL